jgi:hypothetical protein
MMIVIAEKSLHHRVNEGDYPTERGLIGCAQSRQYRDAFARLARDFHPGV